MQDLYCRMDYRPAEEGLEAQEQEEIKRQGSGGLHEADEPSGAHTQSPMFHISIKLDLSMSVAGPRWSQQRRLFEMDIVRDLSRASGHPSNRFEIIELFAGSILVSAGILPDSGVHKGGMGPEKVANELVRQCADAGSALRSGVVTRYVREISFGRPQPSEGITDSVRLEKAESSPLFDTVRLWQTRLPIDVRPPPSESPRACQPLENHFLFPSTSHAIHGLQDQGMGIQDDIGVGPCEEGSGDSEAGGAKVCVRVVSGDNLPSWCAGGSRLRDTYVSVSLLACDALATRHRDNIGHKHLGMSQRMGAEVEKGEDVSSLQPQARTQVAPGKIHRLSPVWKEDFVMTTVRTSNTISEQPLRGQRVALLVTLHNIDAFEEHGLVGRVLQGRLEAGHDQEHSVPLQTDDGSHVFGDDGRPSSLRIGVRYFARARPLVQTSHSTGDLAAIDQQRSPEISKRFGEEPLSSPRFTHSAQSVEIFGVSSPDKGTGRSPGKQDASVRRGFGKGSVLESHILSHLAKRPDAFSPHALSSVLLQLCNACAEEVVREVWKRLLSTGTGGLEDLAVENASNLARRRIVGFGLYNSKPQVTVDTSMFIPRAQPVDRHFIEVSKHFFDAEIYCRQGDGYDELIDWLLTKSKGEDGSAGDDGGEGEQPLLAGSQIESVLVTERRVKEPLWVALFSVIKVSAPWGMAIKVPPMEHEGPFLDDVGGESARVRMLGFEGKFRFAELGGYTIVSLPCGVRDELQMVLVVGRGGTGCREDGPMLSQIPLVCLLCAV